MAFQPGMVVTGMNLDGSYQYGFPSPGQQQAMSGWGGLPFPQQQQQQQSQQQQQQAAPQTQQASGGGAYQGVGPPQSDIRNAFMPPTVPATYANAAGVAGNIGTMLGAGVAPHAAQFLQGVFSPNFNNFENMAMGAAMGASQALLEQGMNRQEAQFENMPFHSGLLQAQNDVTSEVARNLMGTAANMGMQRQQLAAGLAQFPFEATMNAALQGPALMERQFNLYNTAYGLPYQLAQNVWSGIPVPSPVVTGGGGGKGLF